MTTARMTYSDLIQYVSEESGAPKSEVLNLTKHLVNVIRFGLDRDGHVSIPGLGRFSLKWHAARQGRNPQTGEAIQIPARQRVHFKPEVKLRNFINRKYSDQEPKIINNQTSNPSLQIQETEKTDLNEEYANPIPMEENSIKTKRMFWPWLIPVLAIIILAFFLTPGIRAPSSSVSIKNNIKTTPQSGIQHEPANPHPPNQLTRIHTVKAGDDLWALSKNYYQNVYLWPNIFRANQQVLTNPDILSNNLQLSVPKLEGSHDHLTENDRENIAKGYVMVYLAYHHLNKPDAYTYLWVARETAGSAFLDSYTQKIDSADLRKAGQIKGRLQF